MVTLIKSLLTATESPLTVVPSLITSSNSPLTIRKSPFTVRKSPLTVRKSPFTVRKSHLIVKKSPFTIVKSPYTSKRLRSPRKNRQSPSMPRPTHGQLRKPKLSRKLTPKRKRLTPRRSPTPSPSTTDIVRSPDSSIMATVRNPVRSSTSRPDLSITTSSRVTRDPLETITDSGDVISTHLLIFD